MSRRERIAAADTAWLHMDRPTNLMVINGVVWFDAPLDWSVLTKRIESRWVDRYPRFRQRVVEGRLGLLGPQWENDPHFALDNHLHHLALPAPGDQDALQDFVSDRMGVPIDRTKPLWHVYLIDGYGAGCAVLIRVHHSVADGVAMAQVFQSLTDDAPDPAFDNDSPRERRRGWSRLLAPLTEPTGAVAGTAWRVTGAAVTSGRSLVAHPSRLGDVAATGWDNAAAVAKLMFTPPGARTVVTGQTAAAKRAVWSPPIPLDDVKAAGRATGATVNDILLTAVTGALGRYLEAHGTVIDNIRTLVPVNLRPLDRPVPVTLGNKFGLVFLDLPVGLPSPLARLGELSRRMAAIKHSPQGAMAFGLLAGIGRTPIPIEKVLFDFFAAKASAVMTNVPGPRAPWYVAGVPVAGAIGLVPCSGNVPLGVSIFSYAGTVYVGIAVDAVLVPEPQTIVAAFRDELDQLVRQTTKAAEAPTRPRAERRGERT
ncbi:MAG TPA: wax ester/triacylglycerol synthase family O-acyltransferase, partial [Mycobacteriales bacterium]|nr:wax ester/triacylglycerol synthase family O-acyltransferase [Mycobacteriales bacterium]